MLDAASQGRVTALIESATDKRKFAVEEPALVEIKRLCKASNDNLQLAFRVLFERLKAPHAQVPAFPTPTEQAHVGQSAEGLPVLAAMQSWRAAFLWEHAMLCTLWGVPLKTFRGSIPAASCTMCTFIDR
jgi:hypothetical protein